MVKRFLAVLAWVTLMAAPATAQTNDVYIQVQARSSLTAAEDSARQFSQIFENVSGFALGNGWYGVAPGPYSDLAAEAELRRLRAIRAIPGDAYLQRENRFGARFWPIGAAALAAPTTVETPAPAPERVTLPDETPAQARASEAALTRAQKQELQTALAWAGYYNAAIDGAFGRGTRGAMAAWQADQGFETTGVLTKRQRMALLGQYNAVFDGLGLAILDDPRTGISMQMPLDVVALARIEPPFAVYEPTSPLPVRVLLISQPGDRRTLSGLYEIMQTLEIVPLDGPRSLRADGFSLVGRNADIVSQTEVSLQGGAIKGFTLIWPAGDEGRRTRVFDRMNASFATLPGVLDPAAGQEAEQRVDLVAGLQVRQPIATGSGFFVGTRGHVLTSADTVAQCTRITLNDLYEATVSATDDATGLAILTPSEVLAPRRTASFRDGPARLRSEVAVAGYPFGGALGAPTLTFGTVEALTGLSGEDGVKRLSLSARPGDAGGPVLDLSGHVAGMLMAGGGPGNSVLPPDVSFATNPDRIVGFLSQAGVAPTLASAGAPLDPEDLSRVAADMTVLVSCWE